MVQSRTARCAFQSPYLTPRTAVRAVIIAYADKHGLNSERRTPIIAAGVSRPGRIDFAPPMCALLHSTSDAGRPMSRFSGADAVPAPRKEKLWESLRLSWQSSRVERAAWRWREQGDVARIRTRLAERTEGQEYPGERAAPGADRHTDAGPSPHRGGEADVRIPDPAGKDGAS